MSMNFTYQWRKKLRLEWFDYSSVGYYFVTFCTKGRVDYFWEIINEKINFSEMGKIVEEEIQNNIRDNIKIDEYIVMPNHVHMVIVIQNTVGCDGIAPWQQKNAPWQQNTTQSNIVPKQNIEINKQETGTIQSFPTLSRIVRGFKWRITSRIQKECIDGYEFAWQKSFHDVIIRNQEQLDKTREYIRMNPQKWQEDVNNSINLKINE